MAVYRCKLTPLTPVHVGAGGTIALENYFLLDGRLVRFHPPEVVRSMSPAERSRYLALLSGAEQNLDAALKMLREQAQKTPAAWVYSIESGRESRQSLSVAVERLETRRGEVHPLPWNEVKRCAVIPGSAIKGAIRTAVLSSLVAGKAQNDAQWVAGWKQKIDERARQGSKKVSYAAQELEQEVLRKNQRGLEHDPFRFLKVSDVEVKPEWVRLDRAMLLGGGAPQANQIQMHFERLVSACDGGQAPELEFDLTIEKEERQWRKEIGQYLERVPTLERLLQYMRYHYDRRLYREMNRFPELYRAPAWAEWRAKARDGKNCLIRVGRFSHFEALSVEELRGTFDRRRRWVTEGTSRTYCTPDGREKMPFGWAMVHFEQRA